MKLTDHFDTHPETGRAMLPPAESLQSDHDPVFARKAYLAIFCALVAFCSAVIWAVVA